MAKRYLGDGFDIHGGGTDLIFPHHENEIAQSEGASGNPFVRYWLHNGMVNLGGEKMAKSTGLVVDLGSLLDQVDPAALRLLFLRAHYRSQLEYTADLLDDATASLDRLRRFEERIDIAPGRPQIPRRWRGSPRRWMTTSPHPRRSGCSSIWSVWATVFWTTARMHLRRWRPLSR